jgi:hypothetical protein
MPFASDVRDGELDPLAAPGRIVELRPVRFTPHVVRQWTNVASGCPGSTM